MAARPLIREPVRYRTTTRRRRKLDERIWARLPFLIPATTNGILRLPAGSRIRNRLVRYWAKRSYEIVNRRDFELALLGQHPDTVITWTGDAHGAIPPDLVGRAFRGHEGFREAWQVWLDAFDDLTIEPREVSDPGGNELLIGYRSLGKGTTSGIPIETEGFTLYTFEDGLVARQRFFADRGEAERAAGIAE